MREKQRDRSARREREARHSVSSALPFMSGMGLGAGIMYAFDPDRGNRRRAMAQQKLFRLTNLTTDALDKAVRDLEYRAEGLAWGFSHLVHREQVPDDVLVERVRAKLGRVACHPSSIEVHARNAEVILTGPVLRGEAGEIARAVRHVRGVHEVDCNVDEHDVSENIPGLQGRCERSGDKPELLQQNWSPGTRLVMGGLGLALMARALRQPGLLNATTGVLGFALLARSGRRSRVMNSLLDTFKPGAGARAGRRATRIEEGMRTAGLGRRDEVGKSGVYPASGPLPPGPAELRGQASWGQGERGAAGYDDHGTSEMSYSGGQLPVALPGSTAASKVDVQSLFKAGEIPRERWVSLFDQLGKALNHPVVTVEVRQGGQARVEQRDMPLDGIGADLKDRESTITVSVGRGTQDLVVHTISASRVAVRDQGQHKLLEIEATDGSVTIVRFRKSDLRSKRTVA